MWFDGLLRQPFSKQFFFFFYL